MAGLAVGNGDEHLGPADQRGGGEQPACPEHLIVRMRGNHDQPVPGSTSSPAVASCMPDQPAQARHRPAAVPCPVMTRSCGAPGS